MVQRMKALTISETENMIMAVQDEIRRNEAALRDSPDKFGLPTQMWDGPTLSEFLRRELGVSLKVRQCQRLFRHLGFRLRKPRPQVAQADPQLQAVHKKTPRPGAKRRN